MKPGSGAGDVSDNKRLATSLRRNTRLQCWIVPLIPGTGNRVMAHKTHMGNPSYPRVEERWYQAVAVAAKGSNPTGMFSRRYLAGLAPEADPDIVNY